MSDYSRGWAAVNLMVRQGRSWSGHERHCCFLNTRDRQFATVSAVSGLDFPDDGRAVAVTDWDLDGRLDLWIASRTAPRVRFFKNQATAQARFLAIRLTGVSCNRDAIGARLELWLGRNGQTKRIKSLRAGEGFLAQSGKWVHFGLGEETTIDRLIVRWPGGEAEQFTELESDKRYDITQGTNRAIAWTPPKRNIQLVPSEISTPPSDAMGRVVALTRPPMPAMEYVDSTGRRLPLTNGAQTGSLPSASRSLLINLWSSTCAPCLEELREFTKHEQRLRQAGVDVVALCVDELVDGGEAGSAQAQEILEQLQFPFRWGVADVSAVRILDTLHRSLVDLQSDLPLPSSFLIDSKNQLVVMYKGLLSVEKLLDDASLVDASAERLRDAAVPFSGTWITKPLQPYPQEIALKFFEQGQTDEAVEYLRTYLRSAGDSDDPAMVADLADVKFLLGRLLVDRGDIAEGVLAYQQAIRFNPRYRKARINLGELHLRRNQAKKAVEQFEAALEVESDDASTLVALGVAYVQRRRVDRAVRCYQDALRLQPDHKQALSNLARLMHAGGQPDQAVPLYRQILQARPDSAAEATNLAWLLATSRDNSIYNPKEAVQWAERACRATQHQDPRFLTTLAAAYSETGNLRQAVITAKTAIRVAYSLEQPKTAASVETHLRYYEAGHGYRRGRALRNQQREHGGPTQ